jgi:hypothetical protein
VTITLEKQWFVDFEARLNIFLGKPINSYTPRLFQRRRPLSGGKMKQKVRFAKSERTDQLRNGKATKGKLMIRSAD